MPLSSYGPYAPGMAPASQIFQGQLPSAPAAPAGPAAPAPPDASGFDLQNALNMISGISSAGGPTAADVTAALTPTQQAAPGQLPSYFQRQIPQPPAFQQDRTPVVGAGNARGQGIGNVISASINSFAQFKAAHDRNKLEAEGNQVSRFLQAQEGMDQAKQIIAQGKDAPGYAQAQQTLQQNQNLMNGMLADKKFVKTLETGFNVSLTDPSQNKTPEHGIVQKGLDLFRKNRQDQNQPYSQQQVQDIAQRFQASRPQMMAPNVQAQQVLQQKMAMQKAASDEAKAWMPLLRQQEITKQQQYSTQVRALTALKLGEAQLRAKIGIAQLDAQTKGNIEAAKDTAAMNRVIYERGTELAKITAKVQAGTDQAKEIIALQKNTQDDIVKTNKDITDAQAKLGTLMLQRDQSKDKESFNKQIQDAQAHITALQQYAQKANDSFTNQLQLLSTLNQARLPGGALSATSTDPSGAGQSLDTARQAAEQSGASSVNQSDWSDYNTTFNQLFPDESQTSSADQSTTTQP